MNFVGIDIGSTAAKVAVRGDSSFEFVVPTGWSSKETSATIANMLLERGVDINSEATKIVSTGYGRNAVEYADKKITEITCHGIGAAEHHDNCTIIDVGGQDTKVISIENGTVCDFLMNDKCSAGTGKFVEIMANRLQCSIDDLFWLAERGKPLPISSLCTVFAESEIIGHIGSGETREDIASGIVDSVCSKVAQMVQRLPLEDTVVLTGGLSHIDYFAYCLGQKLKTTVRPMPLGRYAGAIGAAELAKREYDKDK
ncbi:MAG: CoA activase [Tissierellia bacterium]|nr:CoA activase [Tissierellia bacterium]